MGITAYGWGLIGSIALGSAWLCISMRRDGMKACLLAALLSVLLGWVGARGYYMLAVNVLGGYPFFGSVISFLPFEHAMSGAVLGVMAGVAIAAALGRRSIPAALDRAVPAGLIAIAAARFAETFSDFGWGAITENPVMMRFPLSIQDMYGDWHLAVFVLEGVCALAVLAVVGRMKCSKPGQLFTLALVWWAMTQVFCESFRMETIRWGFVRVQQVQGAVFALIALLVWSAGSSEGKAQLMKRIVVFAVCVAGIVFCEYALDKLSFIPAVIVYTVMAAALFVMGACAQRAVRQE